MDSVRNQDTWKSIAYWLNIRQLVALILTGNRWMTTVLASARDLTVEGKFYPIAAILSGMRGWDIPRWNNIFPNYRGVIGPFPPLLSSLAIVFNDSVRVKEIHLPVTLTSLGIEYVPTKRPDINSWSLWLNAIRQLTQLQTLAIDWEDAILYKKYGTLGLQFDNLTSLTINVLGVSPDVSLSSVMPISLTQLKVLDARGDITQLGTVIPSLTNLLSLTIPHGSVNKHYHYSLRNLPAQLQELVIKGNSQYTTDPQYYVPIAVIAEIPRTITELDISIDIPNGWSLENLEQLPLRTLKLTARMGNVNLGGLNPREFGGTFPSLTRLYLTFFKTVTVPPSVTTLHITTEGCVVTMPNISGLRELQIPELSQIPALVKLAEQSQGSPAQEPVIFLNMVKCTLDMNIRYVPTAIFLSWLNPVILQSLTVGVWKTRTALEVFTWVATRTKVLTALTLYPTRREDDTQPPPTLPQEFDLPASLTKLSIRFHSSAKLKLTHIPPNVVDLQLEGIITNIPQISTLTQLQQLTIDLEAIMGVVKIVGKPTRRSLEFQLMTFVTALPPSVEMVSVTRRDTSTDSVTRYQLTDWLRRKCIEPNVRTVIPNIIFTLIGGITPYQKSPF